MLNLNKKQVKKIEKKKGCCESKNIYYDNYLQFAYKQSQYGLTMLSSHYIT